MMQLRKKLNLLPTYMYPLLMIKKWYIEFIYRTWAEIIVLNEIKNIQYYTQMNLS